MILNSDTLKIWKNACGLPVNLHKRDRIRMWFLMNEKENFLRFPG